jgi:delta1-piperideine-2-carboxylate reductase
MANIVTVGELTELVSHVFIRHGVRSDNAAPLAATVVAAERDGSLSHGLLRLPGYVATLKSGWADGQAVPVVADAAPGLVATDAAMALPSRRCGRVRRCCATRPAERGSRQR